MPERTICPVCGGQTDAHLRAERDRYRAALRRFVQMLGAGEYSSAADFLDAYSEVVSSALEKDKEA